MYTFSTYSTPPSHHCFSVEWFQRLTLEDAATLDDYPRIATMGSVTGFEWVVGTPQAAASTIVAIDELVPHYDDLMAVFANMKNAFDAGYRAVTIRLHFEGKTHSFLYSFSKLQLIRNISKYDLPRRQIKQLLHHLQHSSVVAVPPDVLEQFRNCKFLEKLSGFFSARTTGPIYLLLCLIGETWLEEDILNSLLELQYFRRHAARVEQDPGLLGSAPVDIVLPTDFLADAMHPLLPACERLRARLSHTTISSIGLARIEGGHYTALTYSVSSDPATFLFGDSMRPTRQAQDDSHSVLGSIIHNAISTPNLPLPSTVKIGSISRQGGKNGGNGSCGLAALNFIQRALDPSVEQWTGQRSAYFRDQALVDLIKYHCIFRACVVQDLDTLVSFACDAVELLVRSEHSGLGSSSMASAYDDYNLYTPLEHHPIFIFHARDRQQSVIPNSIDPPPVEHSPQSSLGRLPRLNELPVDVVNGPVCLDRITSSLPDAARASHALMAPFMLKETPGVRKRLLSQMADKRPRSDSATLSPSSVRPQKRPSKLLKSPSSDVEIITVVKQEASDPIVPKVEDSDTEIEIVDSFNIKIEASDAEIEVVDGRFLPPCTPPRFSIRSGKNPCVIDLVTPPHSQVKTESDTISTASVRATSSHLFPVKVEELSKPGLSGTRTVLPAHPSPRVNRIYDTLPDAVHAVFTQERRLGHLWRRGQSKTSADGSLKKLTLRCNHYRKHEPRHLPHLDPSDFRRGKSVRTECFAHVNINRIRETGQWRITHVDWDHNHPPQIPIGGRERELPSEEQKALIRELATSCRQNFSRSQVAEVLRLNGDGPKLEKRQIGAIMTNSRRDAREHTSALGGDFQAVLSSLEQKSAEDPRWFYHIMLSEAGVVTAIFWQSPTQVELAKRYGDVLVSDACYNRNNVGYPLNIGVVVDGYCKSRNVFYCLQASEDVETDRWMLECYLSSTGYPPTTFMSDRHATLLATVPSMMPLTDHLYCIHHLGSNVDQQLRGTLGSRWGDFQSSFWAVYRAVSPEDFVDGWERLVTKFPEAREYLNSQLFPCRERWAWTFTAYKFTAGIRTNGRVESENRVTKAFGGPKTSIKQLFDNLVERTNGQSVQEMERARDSSRRQHPGQIESIFPGPLSLIRQYGGPFALQQCFSQMEQSVYYKTEVIQRPQGVRTWNEYAIQVSSEPGYSWENSEEQRMVNEFTNEDAYISTRWLLRLTNGRGLQVRHLLRIVHQGTNKAHILAIVDDHTYVCDCAMGMSLGIPCRHYFQALTAVRDFRFHIGVIRARWFQNPNIDVRQIEAVPANEGSLKMSRALAITPSDSPAGSGTAVDTSNNLGQPIAGILANPLHISTPGDAPPPTQTLPAREVFHEIQEAIRPLASAIQTQEQLDDLRESLSSIRRVFLGFKAVFQL